LTKLCAFAATRTYPTIQDPTVTIRATGSITSAGTLIARPAPNIQLAVNATLDGSYASSFLVIGEYSMFAITCVSWQGRFGSSRNIISGISAGSGSINLDNFLLAVWHDSAT
jgi:hypothetical protein